MGPASKPVAPRTLVAEDFVRLNPTTKLRVAVEQVGGHSEALLEIRDYADPPVLDRTLTPRWPPPLLRVAVPVHALREIAGAFDRVAYTAGARR